MLIKKWIVGLLVSASVFTSLNAAAEENLLVNGNFAQAAGQSVTRWVFPPSNLTRIGEDAQWIERGVVKEGGQSVLRIAVTRAIRSHQWWQQDVEALPATTYQLTVRVRGVVQTEAGKQSYGRADIGIYFLNAQNGWIGYEPLKAVAPFDGQWHEVSMKVTTPDLIGKIGVRLGESSNAVLEVGFADARLSILE